MFLIVFGIVLGCSWLPASFAQPESASKSHVLSGSLLIRFTGGLGGPKWFKSRFFIVVFLSVFQDGRGKRFLCIFCVLRCIGRFFFDSLFEKIWTSIKKCRPTIFAYSKAFWLDFQGFGTPETWKKQQKRCLGNRCFLME